MKKILISFVIIVLLSLMLLTTAVYSQFDWTHMTDQPVLDYGAPGEWDQWGVFNPSIIKDGDTLKMWYTGAFEWPDAQLNIGYAWSLDGITWHRHENNPVINNGRDGKVLKEDGLYKMWFNDGLNIRYATSRNGTFWKKLPQIVLQKGPEGDWDCGSIYPGCVIKKLDTYMMWYHGSDQKSPDGNIQIGLITSMDGINWVKHDDPLTTGPPFSQSDPVLKTAGASDWDRKRAWSALVLPTENGFEMLYSGLKSFSSGQWIGYAASPDGVSWKKWPLNPVVSSNVPWGQSYLGGSVLNDFNQYNMWYTSFDENYGKPKADFTTNSPIHDIFHEIQSRPRIGYATCKKFKHDVAAVCCPEYLSFVPAFAKIVIPAVNIVNIGLADEDNFFVSCRIDSSGTIIYSNIQKVENLDCMNCNLEQVLFKNWRTYDSNIYTVSFCVNCSNDENNANNTLKKVLRVTNLVENFETTLDNWDITGGWSIADNFNSVPEDHVLKNCPGNSFYKNNADCQAVSKYSFDLSQQQSAYLKLSTQYQIEPDKDFRYVEVSADGGQTWEQIQSYTGYMSWMTDSLSLDDYCGPGFDDVRIRLHFVSGPTQEWDMLGWFLDDIEIFAKPVTIDEEGAESLSKGLPGQLPKEYALFKNYPNPFNPQTVLSYQLPHEDAVNISVYNLLGQKVKTLVDREHIAGSYKLVWDGRDNSGNKVPSGIYIYKMEAKGFSATKKMLLLK